MPCQRILELTSLPSLPVPPGYPSAKVAMLNPSNVGIFTPIPAGFKFQALLPAPLVMVNSNLFHPGSVKVIVAV